MSAGTSALITACLVNLVVFLIVIFVFSILRKAEWCKRFFTPRVYAPAGKQGPKDLPDGLFAWIMPVILYTEPEIITYSGLDAAIYIRMMTFGFWLFLFLSAYCLIIMLPVNLTDNNIDTLLSSPDADKYKFSEVDKCGLSNVQKGSQRMWAHLISVYVVSGATLFLLWTYSRQVTILRIMFVANQPKGRASHTMLVTDIPGVKSDTNDKEGAIKKIRATSRKPYGMNLRKGIRSSDAVSSFCEDVLSNREKSRLNRSERSGLAALFSKKKSDEGSPPPSDIKPSKSLALMSRKKYDYNVNDTSFDPRVVAEAILDQGTTVTQMVEDEFRFVYPKNEIGEVEVIKDLSHLQPVFEEYESIKQSLDDYVDEIEHKLAQDPPVKVERKKTFVLMPTLGLWGKQRYGGGLIKRVDAFEHFTARLKELDRIISEEQRLSAHLLAPSAFVTFNHRQTHAAAVSSLHQHDTTTWLVRRAPEPEELVWGNLSMTLAMRSARYLGMWVLFWAMVCFFMIPVAFTQALIEAVVQSDSIPGLNKFTSAPVVKQVIEGILPGLALKIFLAIVPLILRLMLIFSGAISESEIDQGVVSRYYIFQVITVFFGTVLTGSFFNQASQWIENPTSAVSILGTAIPQVAVFYMTFVILVALSSEPIRWLRISALVMFWVLSKFAGSPKAKERLWREQYTTYGKFTATHMMQLFLGIVYSCINPLITPFVLTHFAVQWLLERFAGVFVFKKVYESSGMQWQSTFNMVMTSLYIMQITMIGLLSIKEFPYSPFLIPLVFITIIFHIAVLNLFKRPWEIMSMHDAAELDRLDRKPLIAAATSDAVNAQARAEAAEMGDSALMAEDVVIEEPVRETYKAPAFKVVPGAIQELLDQAAITAAKVDVVDPKGAMKAVKAKAKYDARVKEAQERKGLAAKEDLDEDTDEEAPKADSAVAQKAPPTVASTAADSEILSTAAVEAAGGHDAAVAVSHSVDAAEAPAASGVVAEAPAAAGVAAEAPAAAGVAAEPPADATSTAPPHSQD